MNFIRNFFSTSLSLEDMSAAKTKAQNIIDENAVGTFVLYARNKMPDTRRIP
jgi:hypothetical protein